MHFVCEAVIPLRVPLLSPLSGLPGNFALAALYRFPIWPCSAQSLAVFTPAAPLKLPVPGLRITAPDILSVPLFLTLRWRGVTPCAAIWSPDFPLSPKTEREPTIPLPRYIAQVLPPSQSTVAEMPRYGPLKLRKPRCGASLATHLEKGTRPRCGL